MKYLKFNRWYLAAFAALIFSILRGIRYPNMWSTTHALFNHDFDFVKIGLVGAVINDSNIPSLYSYGPWLIVSSIILTINTLLIAPLIIRL